MFSKSILAALTAVATGFVSMPAVAALNHTAIAEHLRSIGVTTSYGVCEFDHGDADKVLGTYNSRTNHFCISNNIGTSEELLDEVVTHELTHVIQDCIGDGIASPNLGSITRYLSGGDVVHEELLDQGLISVLLKREKLEHVNEHTAHMEDNMKWVEVEAYSLEQSPLFVLKLLSKCNRSSTPTAS